jgi:hypothetical protein
MTSSSCVMTSCACCRRVSCVANGNAGERRRVRAGSGRAVCSVGTFVVVLSVCSACAQRWARCSPLRNWAVSATHLSSACVEGPSAIQRRRSHSILSSTWITLMVTTMPRTCRCVRVRASVCDTRSHTSGNAQRYFVNDTFWRPNDGPVFLYITGEWTLSPNDALVGGGVVCAF